MFLWNTCSIFWTFESFEHLVFYIDYICLLDVPDEIGEKSWEFMAGMKQEMQVGRVSKHSKYLMHSVSHSYL